MVLTLSWLRFKNLHVTITGLKLHEQHTLWDIYRVEPQRDIMK